LDEVVAVQQRLLDELRAGKAAAERRLAEALRAVSVTVSVDGGGVNRAADTRDTANTSGGRSSNNPFSRDRDTTPAGGETPVSQGEEDEDEEGEEEEDDDFDIAAVSLAEAAVGAAGGETSAGVYASGDASSGSGNEHEPPPGAMKRQRPPEVEYPVLAFGSRGAAPCASSGEAAAAEATRGAADEKSRGLAASSASGGSEQRVCKQCTLLNGSTAKSCGVRWGIFLFMFLFCSCAFQTGFSAVLRPPNGLQACGFALMLRTALRPAQKTHRSSPSPRTASTSSPSSSVADPTSALHRSLSLPVSAAAAALPLAACLTSFPAPPSAPQIEANAFALFATYGGPAAALRVKTAAARGASAVPAWCAPSGGAPAAVAHDVKRAWQALSRPTRQPWLDRAARALASDVAQARRRAAPTADSASAAASASNRSNPDGSRASASSSSSAAVRGAKSSRPGQKPRPSSTAATAGIPNGHGFMSAKELRDMGLF
jgi:hypothetical protein